VLTLDDVKQRISAEGLAIQTEERLPNDTGTQLRLLGGQIVNVFDSGRCNVQGKNPDLLKHLLGGVPTGTPASSGGFPSRAVAQQNNKVFVVYGHDSIARTQLEAMLRRWGLEPLILDQLPSEGQTIIEKLENLTSDIQFAVVLATPDDEGHRAGHADERAYRARQNVVLELGMLLKQLGRERVAILLKQQENMERPSDIQGLIYLPFKDNLEKEAGVLLAKEMCAQGFNILITAL
jgi:predicted nucleotide-binding protein